MVSFIEKPPPLIECMGQGLLVDMSVLDWQRKGHTRPDASLNTATPRSAEQLQESQLTCLFHYACCYACVVYADRECNRDFAHADPCSVWKHMGAPGTAKVRHLAMYMCEET